MFPGTTCAFLTYDVSNRESFENATTVWFDAVRENTDAAVIMLIGCKTDLSNQRVVSIQDAEKFATRQGLFFMEVSSFEQMNIDLTLKILRIRVSHVLRSLEKDDSSNHPTTPHQVEQGTLAVESSDANVGTFFDAGAANTDEDVYNSWRKNPLDVDLNSLPEDGASEEVPASNYDALKSLYENFEVEHGDVLNDPPQERHQMDMVVSSRLKAFAERKGAMIPVVETNLMEEEHIPLHSKHERERNATVSANGGTHGGTPNSMKQTPQTVYRRAPHVTDPKLYIDVNIGDGRVGQIAVKEGDNAFHLAELFVRAFHLPQSTIRRLAALIQQRVRDYVESQDSQASSERRKAMLEKKKREEARMAAKMEQKPFHFETEKRAQRREPLFKLHVDIGKGKRMGTIAVRKGDDPDALARNFIVTFRLKRSLQKEISQKIKEQVLAYYVGSPVPMSGGPGYQQTSASNQDDAVTLYSTPGNTRRNLREYHYAYGEEYINDEESAAASTGQSQVSHQRESPESLTSNAHEASSVVSSHAAHAPTSDPNHSGHHHPSSNAVMVVSSADPLPPASVPTPKKVLFNLDVDIGSGRSGRIKVYEDSQPATLAKNFATTYKLGVAAVARLEQLIQQNLLLYKQQNRKRIME